jgi:transposase
MVCVRVPPDARPGRRRIRVWLVEAATDAVLELAGLLVAERVEEVTLEAMSDYWRIWFSLLEAAGLDVRLVNAREVKAVPGRPDRIAASIPSWNGNEAPGSAHSRVGERGEYSLI